MCIVAKRAFLFGLAAVLEPDRHSPGISKCTRTEASFQPSLRADRVSFRWGKRSAHTLT